MNLWCHGSSMKGANRLQHFEERKSKTHSLSELQGGCINPGDF